MWFRKPWRTPRFRRALDAVTESLPAPPSEALRELARAWGNRFFSADAGYLGKMLRWASETPGPILECGCGLTTLLLGMVASRRGIHVWSLEHLPKWYSHTQQALTGSSISNVYLLHTPLRDWGGYSWYDVPRAGLPRRFSLVVCDGPPKRTPGGRYGLLPQMKDHLDAETVILLDDANRADERRILERWAAEFGARYAIQPTLKDGLAVVRVPAFPPCSAPRNALSA